MILNNILLLLGVSGVLLLVPGAESRRRQGTSCDRQGTACTPSYGYTASTVCGERRLISQTTYNVSESGGYGPNVCKTVYVYGRNAFRFEYSCRYHYKYYGYYRSCNCYCEKSPNGICDIPVTFTKTEYHCCTGFATKPVASDDSYWYEPHGSAVLRSQGCPMVIQESVADCLDELELTELKCLLEGSDLQAVLESDDKMLTLFALPNEIVNDVELKNSSQSDIEEVLKRHVIEKKVESVGFSDGQSFETLNDDCFIHVTELDKFKRVWSWSAYQYISKPDGDRIFLSGSEITVRDACIATNGIVHIVNRPIECGNSTIADIVETDDDYSILESLLRMVDLLEFLDNESPLLTLLAPTNEAFADARADLGYDLVSCLRNNTDVLRQFLKYHIVCDSQFSSTLVTKDTLTTKACSKVLVYKKKYYYYFYYKYKKYYVTKCQEIDVNVKDSGIEVGSDGALLTGLDIPASNGVIHELSLPLLVPTVDFNELCSGFTGALGPPPPMAPPP